MSTLITLTLPNGTVHLCDESCYNSPDPECTCICEGRNHGQGIGYAERNTIVDAPKIIVAIARQFPMFIELRFHFHNTTICENLARHEVLDAQSAALPHPSLYVPLDDRQLALTNPDHEHLKRTREHPTEAAQVDRHEPDG